MFENYVDLLIENLNIEKKIVYDLILDSGSFNGLYMIGSLLYFNKLEKKEKIKIDRISGTSVGALLGLCYFCDKLDLAIELSSEVLNNFKETNDLTIFLKNFDKILDKIIVDLNVEELKNKYFVTYFDIKKKKQIIISEYDSKTYLKETIRRSIQFPYLLDRNVFYNNYIDGFYPFIFNDNKNKKLFINLHSLNKIQDAIIVKKDRNVFYRKIIGVMEAHNFFSGKKNDLIYNISNWNLSISINLFARKIFYNCLFHILIILSYVEENLNKNYSNFIKDNSNTIYDKIMNYFN